jgi:hypothetical protein
MALAGVIVGLAVRALPAEHRDRYDDEFRADRWLAGGGGGL